MHVTVKGYSPSPTPARADSSYDASRSSSCSEISICPSPGPLDTPPFWLVLRVVTDEVQLFFQIRFGPTSVCVCVCVCVYVSVCVCVCEGRMKGWMDG